MEKVKKYFPSTAKLIKERREVVGISQTSLAYALGYKNGQFVSNAERGLSSFPAEKIVLLAEALNCKPELIIEARVEEERIHLTNVVNALQSGNVEKEVAPETIPLDL